VSVCFAITSALAQYRAAIQGTVSDASGAVVKDATITATDQHTGRVTTSTSNDSGFYSVTNLPAGVYSVTAEAPGFKKKVVTDT
jgi:hypothetical protein